MTLAVGQVIHGRYRVKRLLGQGGFGAVYEVWDESLDQACALKENLGETEDVGRQFMREARLLAKLRHPNLPRVIDYFQVPGQGQYLVMDYIEGDDLETYLRRLGGPVPQAQALAWIDQVCGALSYLHSQEPPVIHRDIKPANIRITPKGQAVLVDFGIAKVFDASNYTTVGARAVTPGFSPPEQYGRGETDARSDIYSLAATLFMLLTGRPPVDSLDLVSGTVAEQAEAAVLNPTISPGVSRAIAQAMQTSKTRRFARVEAFQAALRGAAGAPPVVAPQTAPPGAGVTPTTAPTPTPSPVELDRGAPPAAVAPPGIAPTSVTPASPPAVSPPAGGTGQGAQVYVQFHDTPASGAAHPASVAPSVQTPPAAPLSPRAKETVRVAPARRSRLPLWIGGIVLVGLAVLAGIGIAAYLAGRPAAGPDVAATQRSLAATATALQAAIPPAGQPALTPPRQDEPPPPPEGQPAIRIGLLAPMSGPAPGFGVSTVEGVELAVRDWNERGGVLGRRIELVIGDSQCSADPAVREANRLIGEEGVRYLVGEVCSSASIPVSEIANERQVVQISPTSTNLAVTTFPDGRVKPFTFRSCFVDPFQGRAMARFALERGLRTAFIMVDPGNDYGRGLAEEFERAFTELGGEVVGKETYQATDTGFMEILEKVAASKAQALYLPDYYNLVNLVGRQATQMKLPAVILGGDGWDSEDLQLSALNGSFYSNHYDPADDRPIVQDWIRHYGEVYKDEQGRPKVPDAIATLAFDAANMLLRAIELAGEDNPERVAGALAGLTWEGVSGVISFDPHHNPIKNVVIIGIKDGRKEFIESLKP